MEDVGIIKLFFARSEQAIRELDRKYGKTCYNLSYRIVNSNEDAEECINDAYLALWNTIPPAEPKPLLAYTCKIVRNISLKSYYRKAAVKRSGCYTVAIEELGDCLSESDTAETELEARELAKMIEHFLEALTEKDRVIFVRRYWFADSCQEIGKRVGISENNVTVRLTRIRRKMKNFFAEQEAAI